MPREVSGLGGVKAKAEKKTKNYSAERGGCGLNPAPTSAPVLGNRPVERVASPSSRTRASAASGALGNVDAHVPQVPFQGKV